MIHPIDNIELPKVIENILEYIDDSTEDYYDYYERAWNAANLLYNLSPAILKCKFDFESTDKKLTPELGYHSTPFEIIPFSYNGGDALNYSWVNLTPELGNTDYCCVSYAPGEDGAVLLGNSVAEGLYNLMIGSLREWEEWDTKDNIPPNETNQWKQLIKLIGHFKDSAIKITSGARSSAVFSPIVPSGWIYNPCNDGIGVMAQEKYFSNDYKPFPNFTNFDIYFKKAQYYIKNGQAATAIIILKQARNETIDNEQSISIVQQFKAAYEILNRESHYKRAEIWLSNHTK